MNYRKPSYKKGAMRPGYATVMYQILKFGAAHDFEHRLSEMREAGFIGTNGRATQKGVDAYIAYNKKTCTPCPEAENYIVI